jgi:cyanophycinase
VIDDRMVPGARVGRRILVGCGGIASGRPGWRGARARFLLLWMALGMVGADGGVAAGREGSQAVNPAASLPAGPPAGALVICGGGGLPEKVRERFVALAGGAGAKIVVIPTASGDADGPPAVRAEYLEPWIKRRVASAILLHTRSRARADEPEFVRALDEATGVWFSGGDQSRVTEVYLGTAVERALRRLLERGGVIGGTSAGAAIMSRVMITGGQGKAALGTGFGFLPGTIVDQHALRRNRINRLLGALAEHPDLAGVAIDEATALVVREGRWKVLGNSYVAVCRSPVAGQPMRLDVFHDGDEGDLDARKTRPDPGGSRR